MSTEQKNTMDECDSNKYSVDPYHGVRNGGVDPNTTIIRSRVETGLGCQFHQRRVGHEIRMRPRFLQRQCQRSSETMFPVKI